MIASIKNATTSGAAGRNPGQGAAAAGDGSGVAPPAETQHAGRFHRLAAAIEARRAKTTFITDGQRADLRRRYVAIMSEIGTDVACEHLGYIREFGLYQAVAGNFGEFCVEFLGLDESAVQELLTDLDKPPASIELRPLEAPHKSERLAPGPAHRP